MMSHEAHLYALDELLLSTLGEISLHLSPFVVWEELKITTVLNAYNLHSKL